MAARAVAMPSHAVWPFAASRVFYADLMAYPVYDGAAPDKPSVPWKER